MQELLADVDTPPLEHAEALRTTRERLIDDAATLTDLDRLELRFLERQATRRDVAEELRTAVREPRLVALDRGVRRLRAAAPEDVEALFDLVELRASYLHEGHEVEAATVRGREWHRVRMGRFDDWNKALEAKTEFEKSEHVIAYVVAL